MREVGGHAVGLQVAGIEVAQLVVGHTARIKSFAPQLGQRHNSVACRSTAGAAGMQALHMTQQLGALHIVDQGHVALADAHGSEQSVTDFVFGVDQRIADRVKVVVGHGQTVQR